MVAGGTGGRAWPDSLAHPVSVVLLDVLVARSLRGRRRGDLRWRGRRVTADGGPVSPGLAPSGPAWTTMDR